MKNRLTLLEGIWLANDEDSRLQITIKILKGRPLVSACDRVDGEVFKVRNASWNGKVLKFDLVVPSSGYRTSSEITPLSRNRFVQQVTFWEVWKKQSLSKSVSTAKQRAERQKHVR